MTVIWQLWAKQYLVLWQYMQCITLFEARQWYFCHQAFVCIKYHLVLGPTITYEAGTTVV